MPPEQLVPIRRQEAIDAGGLISSRVVSLGLKDGDILADRPADRSLFIEVMCDEQPDMVITHGPNDYMPDHNAVNRLVFDTTFLATLPGSSSRGSHAAKVPSLFYMDNLSGLRFEPTIYVDISDTIDTKLEMLNQHQSQLVWLKEHDGVDVLELAETLSKFRGMQAGCRYAEGFIQHMVWTRPNYIRFPV